MAIATAIPLMRRPAAIQPTPSSASNPLAASERTVAVIIRGLRPCFSDRAPAVRSPGTSPTTYAPSKASTLTADSPLSLYMTNSGVNWLPPHPATNIAAATAFQPILVITCGFRSGGLAGRR
jgi:hypothetical protein